MPLSEADLAALVKRREAEARAAIAARVEAILAMPDAGERMRAYADLARAAGEDGDHLSAEAEERLVRSFRIGASNSDGTKAMTSWAVERRRMVLVHTLRPVTVAAVLVASALPFIVSAWRAGLSPSAALGSFMAPGRGLAGVALALVTAGVLSRLAAALHTVEGLAGVVVAAFVAGVAGLAVALGLFF